MIVQNAEQTLPIALKSLDNVYDELIIVDGGSTDSTCEIALRYGAKTIHSKWLGNFSQQRNLSLSQVKTDWVFILDSDEFINIKTLVFLNSIKQYNAIDTDNLWIPRRWISPFSKSHYIASFPHYPYFQCRLFKYYEEIAYQGRIHEIPRGFAHPGKSLIELSIYHLDLFINSEEKRRKKVRRYSEDDPRDGARHYYLPEPKILQLEEWDYKDTLPSVQVLLDSQLNNFILTSELNSLIPPEIKNDELYDAIQRIAREEDIKTVLEIGSSSGEGSTEAFVTGLRQNPNKPTLFCMEVSRTRFAELRKSYANDSFVKCYNVSSVSLDQFSDENEIITFYNTTRSNLNYYPLARVLGWLHQDIEYVKSSGVFSDGIKKIKTENNIDFYDVVLIDGSEFTGSAELEEVYGAKFILLDDINTFKNNKNLNRLSTDSAYTLIERNSRVRNGYAIFKKNTVQTVVSSLACGQNLLNVIPSNSTLELPIHFLTIVLNGEPFIRYHIEVFKQLPLKWHWHIVEGVAELKHDTAWSFQLGGRITDEIHRNGYSYDGTTEYLDELAQQYPENITVYRKPKGVFWNGKREMVNEPLFNINEECLLWQVDADELWTVQQICTARQMFIDNPEKTAAFYWCWYFVGENLVISTRNCYAQNPQQEWLRTWRYKPGAVWVAHEPPKLAEPLPNGQWRDVAAVNPFLHEETEQLGLIFQHFAYVTQGQLRFKEQYYGYTNAVSQWTELQTQTQFPVLLRQYFPWVQDTTQVDTLNSCGVVPIAQRDTCSEGWQFLQLEELQRQPVKVEMLSPTIIVDGVFFQLYRTGIARVWRSLLEEWVANGFAKHIVVLDRAGTAPAIPGIRYRPVPPYDYGKTEAEREMLQQVCDEEAADLFISTYYTTPVSTPSMFMAYDMIPEVMGADFSTPMWREKHYGIQHASAFITISDNTARDLVKFFPEISPELVTVALCGVKKSFLPASMEEINSFRTKYGISKPYFIVVGAGSGYKNTIFFFKAFAKLYSRGGFDIICTGSGSLLEAEFRNYTSGSVVHMLQLSDEELRAAYSGAVALVYPSKYEGFGLPVLEALTCGCPVITCPNASIPEVAGQAALYVNDNDVNGLANALCDVQKPNVRNSLIAAGLEQAKNFSWSKMAKTVSSALIDTTLLPLNLKDINLIVFPDWSQSEESLCLDLEQVIKVIATHSDSSQMTLMVDTGNISDEDAALILSSVSMNLLLQEDLDVSEGPEISLIGKLGKIQWEALLPRIHARIVLEKENQGAIAEVGAEHIPFCELESFSDKQAAQFKTGIWDLTGLSEIVYLNRGMTLREQGKLAEAMSSYQKALEIRPDFPEARYQLSLTRYENQLILKGYHFTQDWFSGNILIWEQYLKHFINIPTLNVLEIGSWEGRSTCWLLDNIMTHEHNTITCIDTFEGSVEHRYGHSYIQSLEGRFDFNIVRTGVPDKVKKNVGNSHEVMRSLPLNSYDIVYIDGSHIASDVLQDAVLVWQLVKVGGFIIFDDYPFTFPQNPAWNTKIGIDAFMISFSDKFRVIHKAYQVILEKT